MVAPSQPLRVGLLTDADAFAGTERHMLDLAVGLRSAGADVRLLCPGASPLADRAGTRGIEVIAVEKRGLVDRAAIRTVRRLLGSGQLDIVHAHNGRTALTCSSAARLTGKGRCVVTQHFLDPNHSKQRGVKGAISRAAHRWVNSRIDHFIAISEAARAGILDRGEAPREVVTVIPNGICAPDESRLTPPREIRAELGVGEAPLVVCVARLDPEKDVATLVAAMKEVTGRLPEARCVVAGDGTVRGEVEKAIADHGVGQAVKLLGFRTDALSIINAADVFVLPSLAEPFGLVLLEAMALDIPVVATRAGGPLEIVVDQQTGLLVTPSAPGEMAAALLELLSDSGRRREMGRRGKARFIEHYTVDRMSNAAVGVYQSVLARDRA